MKITVFGSTGKAEQEVIRQALERGYEIVAYAINPSKLVIRHPALSVVNGELNDLPEMGKAIKGSDCVISLLGPSGNVKDTALSDGILNIISKMEKVGVRRFIQISTPSAIDPNDKKDLIFGMMVGL
jgi:putative NADH-flavin reductase